MRTERDSLGSLKIPDGVYYGIQSMRAAQNFPISGTQVHSELIRSYIKLKRAAAQANYKAGILNEQKTNAILQAADQLLKQDFMKHFIVDAYQAGAGTSQNMNVNEVLANIANEILEKPLGSYAIVHPNDDVNMSQSTNDTYPTALRLATLELSKKLLIPLRKTAELFQEKAKAFDPVLKAARTHLQDAVPIRLGQEFGAYAETTQILIQLIESAQEHLCELGIGGSAAGTGINVPQQYKENIIKALQELFQEPRLKLAQNLCSAMQSQLPVMIYSNALRALSLEFTRVFNDLRLLSSGPTNGFAEIILPSTQPGSSIMPGKVNPSVLEMANQVLFKTLGNDTTIAYAMQAGQLELNVMMPVMAQAILESTHILTHMLESLNEKCLQGIQANLQRCQRYAENTSAIATALNPIIGYEKATEITKQALREGKTVLEIVRELKILDEKQIQGLLDPKKLT